MMRKEPSKELLIARRIIDGKSNLIILEDLNWCTIANMWYIKIGLSLSDYENGLIPGYTEWYIVIPDEYPQNSIKIYPSILNGIKETFEHQTNNGVLHKNKLWRCGSLCLEEPFCFFEKYNDLIIPQRHDKKLSWYVERLVSWVGLATKNELATNDDHFELPFYFLTHSSTVAFSETSIDYEEWQDVNIKSGYMKLIKSDKGNKFLCVTEYYDKHGKLVKPVHWGAFIEHEEDVYEGIWLLVDEIPVINRWQAPNTFGELKEAFAVRGDDFITEIEKLSRKLRDKRRHILLIGFPVPSKVNHENEIIYWTALLLPELSNECNIAKQFRPIEKIYKMRDRVVVFSDSTKIEWIRTENWSKSVIKNRGKLDSELDSKNILLIGAGAIGSTVIEFIVREGMDSITIVDHDIVEAGNLTRHTLSIDDIGSLKAERLAKHLNSISMSTKAISINKKLSKEHFDERSLRKYDIIIDCTGSDSVIDFISEFNFHRRKYFFSFAATAHARELIIFMSYSKRLNIEKHNLKIMPILSESKRRLNKYDLPRNGIGCWSPLFPAKYHNINALVGASINVIEDFLLSPTEKDETIVISSEFENDRLSNIRISNIEDE